MSPPPPTDHRSAAAAAAAAAPFNALLSAAFHHLPFSPRPLSKPPLPSPLSSLADRLLRAAADHPFFNPLRSFVQIRGRDDARVPNPLRGHNFAAILPGDSVAGLVVANGLNNFLNIYNTLLVVRLVLTWFPSSPPAIVNPLSTICDPYLNIFRGIIPPLGGTLDLSPILAFLVLNALTSTAAALPAELPATPKVSQQGNLSSQLMLNLTTTQEKWMRRICSKRSKNSEGVE